MLTSASTPVEGKESGRERVARRKNGEVGGDETRIQKRKISKVAVKRPVTVKRRRDKGVPGR